MFRSLGLTVAGGLLGGSLVFVSLGLWGLLVGAAVVVLLTVAVGRRAAGHDRLFAMVGYGMAFVLLTWPVLWVVVGYVRYLITGRALGD